MVKERPILFSAPMVIATLGATKTQTRRVVKPQPPKWIDSFGYTCFTPKGSISGRGVWKGGPEEDGPAEKFFKCPYGKPGDRLWVRETFGIRSDLGRHVEYRASHQEPADLPFGHIYDEKTKWKPSIFMPRWASRITLEITDIRIEKLNDISEKDAIAEGARCLDIASGREAILGQGSYKAHFRHIWESIHCADSWTKNPWVWVVSFNPVFEGKTL